MNGVQKLAFGLAAELAAEWAAARAEGSSRFSVETHANAIMDRVQSELADIRWRRQTAVADGAAVRANAEHMQSRLDEIEGKIHGAVAINDDAYAVALMGQKDALLPALDAARRQADMHEFEARDLATYVGMLETFQRENRAELSTLVAMARLAENRAAMATSYRSLDNLRTNLAALRDDIVRAHAFALAEADQVVQGSPDLHVALLEEQARANVYRHRIDEIRRGQTSS